MIENPASMILGGSFRSELSSSNSTAVLPMAKRQRLGKRLTNLQAIEAEEGEFAAGFDHLGTGLRLRCHTGDAKASRSPVAAPLWT